MLRRGFCEVRPLATRAAVASLVIACLGWVPDALTFSARAPVPENSQCAGKVGCEVSFEVIDNRIFVPVWLNGQGPFHILFDTGAGASVSMEVAEKLKLPREGQTEGSGVGDATVRGYQSHLKAVAIGRASGGATAENIE